MKKNLTYFLLCFALFSYKATAQTFEEYLALFEPIKQDYGFAANALQETTHKKKSITIELRKFIDTNIDTLVQYYPMCVFGDNTFYTVLLVCKNTKQPELLSLVSRLYDAKGNQKATKLDIGATKDFLAYAGEDKEARYSFFTQYNARYSRVSIWYEKILTEREQFPTRGIYRAYTLSAEGYTRYSPTADLNYDPFSNTTPYAPPANAIKVDYKKDKKVQFQVGQILYISTGVHGSVGTGANIKSNKEEILAYLDGHTCYDRVQLKGETGGDSATYTSIFKALKAGKCYIVYKKYFRGKVEKMYKVKVYITK
jgi:hypothetical protein